MSENEEVEEKYNVRVVISSLGNERRTINLGERSKEEAQSVIRTVDACFEVIRRSRALMLTGEDGIVVFANLDNVAFVEVHVG